jgi:hypothetical protein
MACQIQRFLLVLFRSSPGKRLLFQHLEEAHGEFDKLVKEGCI